MRVEYTNRLDDWMRVSAHVRGAWHPMATAGVVTVYAGLSVLTLTFLYLAWAVTPLWCAEAALIVVFAVRTHWRFIRFTPAAARRTWVEEAHGRPLAVELDETHVRLESERGVTQYPWSQVKRVSVVADHIVIVVRLWGVIYIPCSAFADASQRDAFHDAAQTSANG